MEDARALRQLRSRYEGGRLVSRQGPICSVREGCADDRSNKASKRVTEQRGCADKVSFGQPFKLNRARQFGCTSRGSRNGNGTPPTYSSPCRSNCRGTGVTFQNDGVDYSGANTSQIGEHTSELQSLMRISYAVF